MMKGGGRNFLMLLCEAAPFFGLWLEENGAIPSEEEEIIRFGALIFLMPFRGSKL